MSVATERVIEIVEEYNEDRAINGEQEAIANLARALARAEARHYPNDNCGDPDHDRLLEAWYARAEGLLDRAGGLVGCYYGRPHRCARCSFEWPDRGVES